MRFTIILLLIISLVGCVYPFFASAWLIGLSWTLYTALILAGLLCVSCLCGYFFSKDLRWLYGAFSIAVIPILAQLIWRERISLKDLFRPRNLWYTFRHGLHHIALGSSLRACITYRPSGHHPVRGRLQQHYQSTVSATRISQSINEKRGHA